jgi:hypothetical protein
MLISNPLTKLPKTHANKSYQQKTNRKIEFLTFYNSMQKFSALTSLGYFVCIFFNRFQLNIKFCAL